MNEINIILNSDITNNIGLEIAKNDKEILYEKLNNELHIIKAINILYTLNNDLSKYKLLDFIYNDDFIDYINNLDLSKENINKSDTLISGSNIIVPKKNKSIYGSDMIVPKINKNTINGSKVSKSQITMLDKSAIVPKNKIKPTIENKNISNANDISDFIKYNLLKINHDDSILSKKIIIKKILEFIFPIIDKKDLESHKVTLDLNKKKNNIIDIKKLTLNYSLRSKYVSNKDIKTYTIPAFEEFTIHGLFNEKNVGINVPYKYNKFKYDLINIIKRFCHKKSNKMVINNINYANFGLFTIESIKITDLLLLYELILSRFELYLNNKELLFKCKSDIKYIGDIAQSLEIYNKSFKSYIDQNFYNNYITKFNKVLNYKISNSFNNNIYTSFYNDNLLNLYENSLIYSIDSDKIVNKINYLIDFNQNKMLYNKNQKVIENKKLVNSKLEFITKNKFPNLFNKNSKDNIFNQFTNFNINSLPKKIKDVVLLEYKKNDNYINNFVNNKCPHIQILKDFSKSLNKYSYFNDLLKFINKSDSTSSIYKCNVCSFNLICPHIVEYYKLLFSTNKTKDDSVSISNNDDYIHQKILNKYMGKAPIDMIYYCKVCGEELGQSADMEQNVEFKDNVRMNAAVYTDETTELIYNSTSYIVYTYLTFSNIKIDINKKTIINYIISLISFYINNIEKKLRKSKNTNDEQVRDILTFNIIIFIYAAIIFIMNKYNNIIFISKYSKPSSIIVKKSSGKSQMNILKERFKQSFDIIINTNNILLNKLQYNKNLEVIKEILVKTYTIINTNDNIEVSEKGESDNLSLVLNSPVYQYYYDVLNTYPLSRPDNKKQKIRHLGSALNYPELLYSNNKKIKYDDYRTVLGDVELNKKPEYLFNKFTTPNYQISNKDLMDIESIDKIDNYNEYKYISFLTLYYYIKNNIYEIPPYEFINNDPPKNKRICTSNIYDDQQKIVSEDFTKYEKIMNTYLTKSKLLKTFEMKLINNNLIYNLYPYSKLKLNNLRYYYDHTINLNTYICNVDGKEHKYNIYIYVDKNKKELVIKKSDIDKSISSNVLDNCKFIDYQCSKCKKYKNKIIAEGTSKNILETNNNKIINTIQLKNDINNFYNIYKNKCPVKDYHSFNKNKECIFCHITFQNILEKDEEQFTKYRTNFNTFAKDINVDSNKVLKNKIEIDTKLYNSNIIKEYNIYDSKFIDTIDNLNLDDLMVKLSKTYNVNIFYFNILGLTEGFNYNDLGNITISYDNIDNRFIKLTNYIRTLSIYYNLLINIDKVTKYYDYDFMNILNEIKVSGITKTLSKTLLDKNNLLINNEYNLINLFQYIKLTSKDNKYIINFGLKIIYKFIHTLCLVNENKLNNKLDKYILFIIKKIFKFDELFTNYSYAQLKQMFTENMPFSFDEMTYNEAEDENEEDDDLFSYSNVDIEFGDTED